MIVGLDVGGTHTDVAREENDESRKYYYLVRHKTDKAADSQTDVGVVEQDNISITPLHIHWLNRSAQAIPDNLSYDLFHDLKAHSSLKTK